MTQDLLKLAEECESIATEPDVDTQIYELTTTGAEMLARSTIALREAHAEIERKGRQLEKSEREYLDIRSELEKARLLFLDVIGTLKYYSEECDSGCFADWGERAKSTIAALSAAKEVKE